jgi:hypothetical protein
MRLTPEECREEITYLASGDQRTDDEACAASWALAEIDRLAKENGQLIERWPLITATLRIEAMIDGRWSYEVHNRPDLRRIFPTRTAAVHAAAGLKPESES